LFYFNSQNVERSFQAWIISFLLPVVKLNIGILTPLTQFVLGIARLILKITVLIFALSLLKNLLSSGINTKLAVGMIQTIINAVNSTKSHILWKAGFSLSIEVYKKCMCDKLREVFLCCT